MSNIQLLVEQMNGFYDVDFKNDEDEYLENKKIKSKIVDFILDCKVSGDANSLMGALNLLSENTGCQEDVEILQELLDPLIKDGVLNVAELKECFGDAAISRWE